MSKDIQYWNKWYKWECPRCGYTTVTSGSVQILFCKRCNTKAKRKRVVRSINE